MYTSKAEDYHAYSVTDCNVWVHNRKCPSYINEDGTLKPNQEYTVGEHDYLYKTDANGNICHLHEHDILPKTHQDRLDHDSNII